MIKKLLIIFSLFLLICINSCVKIYLLENLAVKFIKNVVDKKIEDVTSMLVRKENSEVISMIQKIRKDIKESNNLLKTKYLGYRAYPVKEVEMHTILIYITTEKGTFLLQVFFVREDRYSDNWKVSWCEVLKEPIS